MSKWLTARVQGRMLKPDWPDSPPPDGKQVLVQVRTPRNIAHHRKYWAMLRHLVEATGVWQSADEAHRWVKIETGHYMRHPQPDGSVLAELLPTDFAAMPQAEFKQWFDLAMLHFALETGVDPETLMRETE